MVLREKEYLGLKISHWLHRPYWINCKIVSKKQQLPISRDYSSLAVQDKMGAPGNTWLLEGRGDDRHSSQSELRLLPEWNNTLKNICPKGVKVAQVGNQQFWINVGKNTDMESLCDRLGRGGSQCPRSSGWFILVMVQAETLDLPCIPKKSFLNIMLTLHV